MSRLLSAFLPLPVRLSCLTGILCGTPTEPAGSENSKYDPSRIFSRRRPKIL